MLSWQIRTTMESCRTCALNDCTGFVLARENYVIIPEQVVFILRVASQLHACRRSLEYGILTSFYECRCPMNIRMASWSNSSLLLSSPFVRKYSNIFITQKYNLNNWPTMSVFLALGARNTVDLTKV